MNGLDEVGLTLADEGAITRHEKQIDTALPFLSHAVRNAA